MVQMIRKDDRGWEKRMDSTISKDKKIRPYELAHVNFHTPNLEEMKDWYLTVLEGEIVFADENFAFLTIDGDFHRIALIRNSMLGKKSGREAAADHSAFAYKSLGELIHTYERLEKVGICPVRVINHGPTISLYYRDPDGNHVELQVNRFQSMSEIREYLKDGTFAADPIGVEFDIGSFIERFRSGQSTEELFRITYSGDLSFW